MGQISFSDAEYAGKRKKTRREVFFAAPSARHKTHRQVAGTEADQHACLQSAEQRYGLELR